MAPTATTTDETTYQSLMDGIETMPPADLAALRDKISAAFEEADSKNDTDGMAQAADANDAVQAAAQKRGIDLDNLPEEPAAEPAPDGQADTSAVAAAEPDQPKQEAAVDAPAVTQDRQPLPVAVAASTIVAGADVPGVSAGMPITDKGTFVQAMTDKINALRGARGDGEQVIVASVKAPDVPDERTLTGDSKTDMEKVFEVIGRDQDHMRALVASGGYCAPLEPRYDVFGIGVTDRPVRGALPGFRASRGGIRFISPPKLASVSGSVGVWTAATDAAPGGAVKAKMIVGCGPEQTVTIAAITLQMQFGNFIARAYPEMVERNTELGMIAQARLAEQTLLTAMGTLSTAVTTSHTLGTARDFLNALGRAASAYRTRHRMAEDAPLSAIAPAWVRDAMRDDIAWSLSPTTDDVLAEADSIINGYISKRNVNVAWHLDDPNYIAAQAAGALANYPATFDWLVFAPGTFLFLDGGTLDVGVVRDSTLVGTNDYIQFTENFEAVAMVGVESLKVTTTTHVRGGVSAAVAVS